MDLISALGKGAPSSTQGEWIYTPLSTALFFVLLHAGIHGVSVCEALRKLIRQGYSKLLNSNSFSRALQVKIALRTCPAFKELDSRRFILRYNKEAEQRNRRILLRKFKKSDGNKQGKCLSMASPCDKSDEEGICMICPCNKPRTIHDKGLCMEGSCNQPRTTHEKGFYMIGPCDRKTTVHAHPLTTHDKGLLTLGSCATSALKYAAAQPCDGRMNGEVDQCCMIDGKHWGCIQHTNLGSLYSDNINQNWRRDRAIVSVDSPRCKDQDEKPQFLRMEKRDFNINNLSGQSREKHQGEKPKLDRCRRTDGKRWQCSKQVQVGSIYCEHHHKTRKRGLKSQGDGSGHIVGAEEATEQLQSLNGPTKVNTEEHVIEKGEGTLPEPMTVARESNWALCGSETQGVVSYCNILMEKKMHEGQEAAKLELRASESGDLEDVQRSKKKLKPMGHGQAVSLEAKQEVLEAYTVAENLSADHKGNSFQDEPLNAKKAVNMPHFLLEEFNKTLTELRDFKQLEGQVSYLDRSSTVSEESTDVRGKAQQCHRKDGKGWQCSRQCKPGYIYCDHHQGRRSRGKSSINGEKKLILQLELDKQVLATCLKGHPDTQVLRVAMDMPQSVVNSMKTKASQSSQIAGERDVKQGHVEALGLVRSTHVEKSRDLHVKNSVQQFERCHRKDGKGWQCSQQCKHGSIYCDRHQGQCFKSRSSVGSQANFAMLRELEKQVTEYAGDQCTDMKQVLQFTVDMSQSSLKPISCPSQEGRTIERRGGKKAHFSLKSMTKPSQQGQSIERRSGKQEVQGVQAFCLGTALTASTNVCCCVEESTTVEKKDKGEEKLEKCHRRDGKKWQCSQLCMPGYNHCEHHQGRGRRVKT